MAGEPEDKRWHGVATQKPGEAGDKRFGGLLVRRLLLSATLIVWLLTMWLLCYIGPEIHNSYLHFCRVSGAELGGFAQSIALPVFGPPAGVISPDLRNHWIRYVYWGLVFLPPLAMGMYVWRIRDRRRLMEVWACFCSAYFITFACSAILIALFLFSTFIYI